MRGWLAAWQACLLALLLCQGAASAQRVAVVGGGVAGATAAYYLRKELGAGAEIAVFERDRLGGRARELEYEGLTLELGASMVWSKNFLIKDLADAAGLERQPLGGGDESGGLFAVYDGRELVFAESSWGIVTLLRLLWRYWFSWFSFKSAPAAAFDKFQGIYPLLDAGKAFDRPTDLLKATGLYDYTQASMFEFLRVNFGRDMDLLASELIYGINKCNYNQGSLQLNALAGLVSMLPATEPSAFRIKGGNGQLSPRLLALANASVTCPCGVGSIQRLPDGRFTLSLSAASSSAGSASASGAAAGHGAGSCSAGAAVAGAEAGGQRERGLMEEGQQQAGQLQAGATQEGQQEQGEQGQPQQGQQEQGEQGQPQQGQQEQAGLADGGEAAAGEAAALVGKEAGPFDAVIVATPLESSGISFSGFNLPIIPARKYTRTISTFVKGSVRASYFGLPEMTYSTVLVSEAASLPWSALGLAGRIVTPSGDNSTVWKLFSSDPLPHAWLSMMFEAGFEIVATQVWDSPGAYPAFDSPEDFAPFKLTEGLYYAAALENAASALEIAAIEGRLTGQMAAQHVRQKQGGPAGAAGVELQQGQDQGAAAAA